VCDGEFGPFRFVEESDNGVQINYLPSTFIFLTGL
jgi:hypothetical protein